MSIAPSPETNSGQRLKTRGDIDLVLGNVNETLALLKDKESLATGPIVLSKVDTIQNMILGPALVEERARVFREAEDHRAHLRFDEADELERGWRETLENDASRATAVDSLRSVVKPQFIEVVDGVLEEAGEIPPRRIGHAALADTQVA